MKGLFLILIVLNGHVAAAPIKQHAPTTVRKFAICIDARPGLQRPESCRAHPAPSRSAAHDFAVAGFRMLTPPFTRVLHAISGIYHCPDIAGVQGCVAPSCIATGAFYATLRD